MSATEELVTTAEQLGFDLCGIAAAEPPKTFPFFDRWLAAGMHAGQTHFVRNYEARRHPEAILAGVQSILMLGVSYGKILNTPHAVQELAGIAEYARGMDYHLWIKQRLAVLAETHAAIFPTGRCRGVCDTAPILEKQYAADAGLGTVGKNTLLIHPRFGSKIFLAALLSTEKLEQTQPVPFAPCGTCTQCLDACPAGALSEPYVLDSRRCLSYWYIVHQGEVPAEIAALRKHRFFGCDTCQQVCPHNAGIPMMPKGTVDPFSLPPEDAAHFTAGSPIRHWNSGT